MKTPRELLLERHRSEGSRLDAIRRDVLVAVQPASAGEPHRQAQPRRAGSSLLALLLPFRWHLAGMSAAWILIALFNIDSSSAARQSLAQQEAPSPTTLRAALRENRRQIAELIESSPSVREPALQPPAFVPQRRSDRQSPIALA